MSNLLQKAGGQPSKPIRYGVIWTNRMATGLWSQSHLYVTQPRTRIEEEFYGARGDALIDGLNIEVSPALTFIRRPGQSVYNSQTFPAGNRFYENRLSIYNAAQTQAAESIQVIYDTAADVYDATGPSTKNVIFVKSTGAGKTSFQSVGNALYFSDGPDQKKLITPDLIWAPNQLFQPGDQVLDSNGNIEVVQGTGTAPIASIAVVSTKFGIPFGPTHYFLAITFGTNVYWANGTPVTFSGITNYTALNGQTLGAVVGPPAFLPPSSNVAYFPAIIDTLYGPIPDTGTATSTSGTGGGTSGATAPAWNVTLGGITSDGQLTWQNFGVPIYDWATDAPPSAPILNPVAGNRQWRSNTVLAVNYAVLDNNGNVQVVIVGGTTGQKVPIWNTQIPQLVNGFILSGSATTITQFGGTTQDGSVQWRNIGAPASWEPISYFPLSQVILDSNGNWQYISSASGGATYGTTGSTQPTWSTVIGGTTTDGTITWTCLGPGTVLITGQVQYAYSWHSIDGSVTTASPIVSQNFTTDVVGPPNNGLAILSGTFPTDKQIDAVWIWRTVQGGGVMFFDASIPNPTPGTASNWYFEDFIPDTSLNEDIEAPIADENDPPPVGITALTYHLGRIFGGLGNSVRYSDGPDVNAGNGDTAWNPSNIFIFPSTVTRLYPTTYGLVVFTLNDPYLIQGQGTAASPLIAIPFLQYLGLVSYDAFTVNGGIVYMYTSDNQIVSLDPNGGVSEVGFPIGDQFGPSNGTRTFTPSSAQLTWHISGSQDKGLYVSDGQGTWWRLCPTPAPETGLTWSPKAQLIGGFSVVQSVETVPGTHNLLVAPLTSGPILKRDYSVYSDNGSAYNAFGVLGSVVLAQPGQFAEVESFTTDAQARGSLITLAVQLDEILDIPYPNGGTLFEPLTSLDAFGNNIPDPTQLVAPTSLYAQRFYLSQTQEAAWCRHLQIQFNFGTDTVKNELLALSIFGGWEQEK